MDFKIGEINTLLIGRKTDIGYMLFNDYNEEVFLHNNQAQRTIKEGDKIEVFIYFDGEKRLTATMETPFIKVNSPGFVKVKSVLPNLGVFIDNNIAKDPLISLDDLPKDLAKWPKTGDTIFCKLKNTQTQLIAKIVTPEELKTLLIPTTILTKFQKVEAYVVKSGLEGVNLITPDGHSIFVYYKHKRRDYRIGELVTVTITNLKPDSTYNGTLLETKVPLIKEDSEIILNYLKDQNGYMPFTTKSDVKDIETTFNMSKASFKRALGNLYKQRLIDIKENGTYLLK